MQDLQNLSIKYSDSSYLVYTLYNKETPVDTTTSDKEKKEAPDAGRAIAADVAGAAAGATTLFGAIFGACAMSVYDLYQQGAFTESLKPDSTFTPNPINPYDNIGKHHNTILVEYINQYHKTNLKGSQLDTLTNFITKRITELNPDLIVEENQYDAHQFINIYHNLIDTFATNFHLDYFLDLMNIKNYINIEEKEILALFLSTVQNLPLDRALHYTKDFEAVILTNTTLIHDSKEKILASLSVARNSLEPYDKYRYL